MTNRSSALFLVLGLLAVTLPIAAQDSETREFSGKENSNLYPWDAYVINKPEYGLWAYHAFVTQAVSVESEVDGAVTDPREYRLMVTEHQGVKRIRLLVPEQPIDGEVDVVFEYLDVDFVLDRATVYPSLRAKGYVRGETRPIGFSRSNPATLTFGDDEQVRILTWLSAMDSLNHPYEHDTDAFRIIYYNERNWREPLSSYSISLAFNLNRIADLRLALYQ